MHIVLGIGDIGASNREGDVIKTYALGSCVGLVIIDLTAKVAGMAHIALPDSRTNLEKAQLKPGYFANTGIPALINLMKKKGSNFSKNNIVAKLAGGANIMDPNNTFNIGQKNINAIKNILTDYQIIVVAEDVGGSLIRTISIKVGDYDLWIESPGLKDWSI